MSEVKDVEAKNLEEEVVVNEATELVNLEKEAKKAKVASVAKKGLKIAGVAAVGIIGYLLGSKLSRNSSYEDDSEIIEVDYETEESDEE